MRNMIKVNNKGTMTSFCWLWSHFTSFSCVSVVDLEQVHVFWSCFKNQLNSVDITGTYSIKSEWLTHTLFSSLQCFKGHFLPLRGVLMVTWNKVEEFFSVLLSHGFLSLYPLFFSCFCSEPCWVNLNSSVIENMKQPRCNGI